MTHITRRQTTGLLLAGTAAALAPITAHAMSTDALAKQLGDTLNAHLSQPSNTRFGVVKFELSEKGSAVKMRSVVQLNWSPGTRRRAFRSTGTDRQEALKAMIQGCLDEFRDALPKHVLI